MASYREGRNAAVEIQRWPDARLEHYYLAVTVETAMGDLLGAADDPNFGDTAAALDHYRAALALAERFAAPDSDNLNARRYVAFTTQRIGMTLLVEKPEDAIAWYQRAISERKP